MGDQKQWPETVKLGRIEDGPPFVVEPPETDEYETQTYVPLTQLQEERDRRKEVERAAEEKLIEVAERGCDECEGRREKAEASLAVERDRSDVLADLLAIALLDLGKVNTVRPGELFALDRANAEQVLERHRETVILNPSQGDQEQGGEECTCHVETHPGASDDSGEIVREPDCSVHGAAPRCTCGRNTEGAWHTANCPLSKVDRPDPEEGREPLRCTCEYHPHPVAGERTRLIVTRDPGCPVHRPDSNKETDR